MKSICSNWGVLASFIQRHIFLLLSSLPSHHRSYLGLHQFLFEHSFLACVTHTHTQRGCCQNASSLSCQEATSSAQQLGPLHFFFLFFFLWLWTDPTRPHTPGSSFRSISPTEEAFKRSAPLGRSHSSLRSTLGTDLGVHAHLLKRPIIACSLTRAWRLARLFAGISDTPCP